MNIFEDLILFYSEALAIVLERRAFKKKEIVDIMTETTLEFNKIVKAKTKSLAKNGKDKKEPN